jgi:hypothetical protein
MTAKLAGDDTSATPFGADAGSLSSFNAFALRLAIGCRRGHA